MVSSAQAASPGYRPRAARNALKEIVEDFLEELLRLYDQKFSATYGPMHPRVKKLFEDFLKCGDAHFGFLRLYCHHCKQDLIVPYSCKVRGLCSSCGQKRAIAWAERMVEEVLPDVDYAQIIFTIPKMLRQAFLFNRSLVGELCRVAYDAIRMFYREHFPNLKDSVPAVIIAPQSFGSLLNPHVHLHSLVSIGVFDGQGNFHPATDLDFSPLEKIFQELTFKMMLKEEAVTEERVELLQSWQHSGFHIGASRRVAQGNRDELERLLQYFERPPVSLDRLSYFADGRVLYRGGKFHPGLGRDHQLVSGVEFLAMLVPHILLRYECSIRYYGAISTTIRRKLGWIKKGKIQAPQNVPVIEGEDSEFLRVRKRNWARLIKKVWLEDPSLCPRCGKPLEIIAAINSPAQDDVIEKILKAKKLWDPPWLRKRSARGPPPSTPAALSPESDQTKEWMDPPHQDYPDEQYPED